MIYKFTDNVINDSLSWNDVKRLNPNAFEEFVSIVRIRNRGCDKSFALDIIDENWSFYLTYKGAIQAVEDETNFRLLFE